MSEKEITKPGEQTKLFVRDGYHKTVTELSIRFLDTKLDVWLDRERLTTLVNVLQLRLTELESL